MTSSYLGQLALRDISGVSAIGDKINTKTLDRMKLSPPLGIVPGAPSSPRAITLSLSSHFLSSSHFINVF